MAKQREYAALDRFLAEHSEFGRRGLIESRDQGKRLRVRFGVSRILSFYLDDGEIVSVYEEAQKRGGWGVGNYTTLVKLWGVDQALPPPPKMPKGMGHPDDTGPLGQHLK